MINEVLIESAGSDQENEFIELRGPVGTDLTGYRLVAQSGASTGTRSLNVELRGVIGPSGTFVVGGSEVANLDQLYGCTSATGCITNTNGNNILLYDCDGETLVDGVAYGSFDGRVNRVNRGAPAPLPPRDRTLSRCPGAADSGSNAADFGVAAPTPGATNGGFTNPDFCGGNGGGPDPDPDPTCTLGRVPGLVINEVLIESAGSDQENEFIELRGPVGADLTGYRLVAQSGASTGTRSLNVELRGVIGPSGTFVVGGSGVANLDQNYGCTTATGCITNSTGNNILLLDCDGETMVDGVAYGSFESRINRVNRGAPAPLPPRDRTLARCPGAADSGNNAADFGVASPTPGAANGGFTNPDFCGGNGGGPDPDPDPDPDPVCVLGRVPGLLINEVLVQASSPLSDVEHEFIELRGPAGASVAGYRLVVQSGASTGQRTLVVDLQGTIGASGLFVVGGSAVEGLDQLYGCTASGGCIINTTGNNILLYDCDGETVVDGVAYGDFSGRVNRVNRGEPAPLPPRGRVLARCPGATDTEDNRADFGIADPTPGQVNGPGFAAGFCTE